MGYYAFDIKISDESRDAVAHLLLTKGSTGFIENNDNLTAYFPDFLGINKIVQTVNELGEVLRDSGLDCELSFEYVYIGERDWNESWKKRFVPIDIGQMLTIIPPWHEEKRDRICLIIDPGMAFGTGHHETTKTCLMLIEKYSKKDIKKNSFLDFGTGTGILAIAALKLGFKKALCIDIDQLAINASKINAELNNIENIEIVKGDISAINGIFDFISANLMSDILIQNANQIALRLNKSGIVLLSGILVGQEDDVINAFKKVGLQIKEKIYDGRWVSIVASF